MKLRIIFAFLLLPFASLLAIAEEPEAVYAKFHRAAMAGDLDDMLNHGPANRRAEMRGLSAAHREAALKMARFMMPRAFTLERKVVHSAGRATLVVSGPGDGGGGRLQAIYGTILMVTEGGAWKVDEANWSNEKPALLAAPKPAPQAAKQPAMKAAPAAKSAAAATGGAPVVGSMAAPTARKLGPAKAECVYKPVMTAEDVENCK